MKKENLYKTAHFLSGVVVILHGISEMDKTHGTPLFFFIAGILMLLVAAFHHRVEKWLKNWEGLLFFIEGAVQFFIAIHYFEYGKKALPYAHLFTGTMYCYVGYLKLLGQKPFWIRKK